MVTVDASGLGRRVRHPARGTAVDSVEAALLLCTLCEVCAAFGRFLLGRDRCRDGRTELRPFGVAAGFVVRHPNRSTRFSCSCTALTLP